jgi:hypothetical protein
MDGQGQVRATPTDSAGVADFRVPVTYELLESGHRPWRVWTTDTLGYESTEIRLVAGEGDIYAIEPPLQPKGCDAAAQPGD